MQAESLKSRSELSQMLDTFRVVGIIIPLIKKETDKWLVAGTGFLISASLAAVEPLLLLIPSIQQSVTVGEVLLVHMISPILAIVFWTIGYLCHENARARHHKNVYAVPVKFVRWFTLSSVVTGVLMGISLADLWLVSESDISRTPTSTVAVLTIPVEHVVTQIREIRVTVPYVITATPEPSLTPTPTPSGYQLLLVYNQESFFLKNMGNKCISLKYIKLRAMLTATGTFSIYGYDGGKWDEGNWAIEYLASGHCVGIMEGSIEYPESHYPGECEAPEQVNARDLIQNEKSEYRKRFWTPLSHTSDFKIYWNDTEAGRCAFSTTPDNWSRCYAYIDLRPVQVCN